MTRVELIQKVIDTKRFKKYLEIGSFKGESFFPVNCKYKIAVDPKFYIPIKRKLKWIYKNPHNLLNKYFEFTSDDFFNKKQKFIKNFKPEIVFVDGLHTFKASLLDVLNSLKIISKNGVIIMHDCLPPHKAGATYANSYLEAAHMNLEGWTGEWTGDVWKTIMYLIQKYNTHLKVHVLNTDYGLGYITVNTPISNFEIDQSLFKTINKSSYEDLMANTQLINLRDRDYHHTLLND